MKITNKNNTISLYQICIHGYLDSRWSDWFDGFRIVYEGEDTILFGSVPDQAALHGIFAKIRDLGLSILLVQNLNPEVEIDDKDGESYWLDTIIRAIRRSTPSSALDKR